LRPNVEIGTYCGGDPPARDQLRGSGDFGCRGALEVSGLADAVLDGGNACLPALNPGRKPSSLEERPPLNQSASDKFLRSRPIRPHQRPSFALIAAVFLLSATIIAWFVVDLQNRYFQALAEAERTAGQFADVLAEHTARTFEGVERALSEAEQVRRLYDAGLLGTIKDGEDALRRIKQTSPVIIGIGWTDASGDVQVHSSGVPPRANLANLAFFARHRDNKDGGYLISKPYIAVGTGDWMTAVSQRIATPDGSFAGVVTVALDLSYFSGLYAVIVGNSGASVMLVHREGVVQLRVPPLEGIVGESFRDSKLFSEYLLKSDRGSYQTSAGMDGVPRVVGYRAVKNVPLVALFSYPRANVLAPWYRNLYIYGSVTALQLIIIMIGTGVLVRRAGALVEAKKSIEDSNARFVIATSNMSQGWRYSTPIVALSCATRGTRRFTTSTSSR
jgi:Cache domain